MPRPRQRACLEQSLRLDLNNLARQGLIRAGAKVGPRTISWSYSYTGEEIASALITAHMEGTYGGWLQIQIGSLDQWINLVAQPRHFGGRQLYFECPVTHRYCSALWMPPGATKFCSRRAWDGQVAYASQFQTPTDRAHGGQAKIKSRLIGELDPDEWHLPPKPKWMRWHTYNKHVEKFDRYEELLDVQCSRVASRLLNWG
jgi:hypothetical protein